MRPSINYDTLVKIDGGGYNVMVLRSVDGWYSTFVDVFKRKVKRVAPCFTTDGSNVMDIKSIMFVGVCTGAMSDE